MEGKMIPAHCDKCKMTMMPLVPAMDLDKAEWYCPSDHLSKRMSHEDAVRVVEARQARMAQGKGQR
jgi:hypothetical protein